MTQPIQHKAELRFGEFEADLQTGELRRNGHRLRLREKSLQLLTILLERPGRVLTKEELQHRLWPDVQVDAEAGLTEAAYKLRQALGDSAKNPRYIETLPKRGYRFIATVEPAKDSLDGSESTAQSDQPVSKRELRVYQGLLALATLVCTALVFSFFGQELGERPVRQFTLRPLEKVRQDPSGRPTVSISPNGRFVAFVAGEQEELWVNDLEQGVLRAVEGVQRVRSPFWSPDSEFILFGTSATRPRSLQKVPAVGGPVTTICDYPRPDFYGGTVSKDREVVVYANGGAYQHLWQVPFDGGEPKEVFSSAEKDVFYGELAAGGVVSIGTTPYFLPSEAGERVLVFGVGLAESPAQRLVVFDMVSRHWEVLGPGHDPVYSRSGHLVFSDWRSPRSIWALPFSLKELRATGERFLVRGDAQTPTMSQSGTLCYLESIAHPNQLVWRSRTGTRLGSLGPGHRPEIAPDGLKVAYDLDGDIYVHDLPSDVKTNVTSDQAGNSRAVWHPDSKRLYFASSRGGTRNIWATELDRVGRDAELVFPSPDVKVPNDLTPDGKRLVYNHVAPGTPGLLLSYLERDDQASQWIPQTFLGGNSLESTLSPDGQYIAYQTPASGVQEVYVERFPEGGDQKLVSTNPGRAIQGHWRRDGKELFFISGTWGDVSMYAVPVARQPALNFGTPKRLFRCDPTYYDVSADGQRFLISEKPAEDPELTIHFVQNWYEEFRDRKPN